MIKVFHLVPPLAGVSAEQFAHTWDLLSDPEITGLRRYVQCRPYRQPEEKAEEIAQWAFGPEFPYAAVAEFSFDSLDDWLAMKTEITQYLADELEDVADSEQFADFVTSELVVVDGAIGKDDKVVKALFFPRRLPGMSVDDFQEYWRTKHAAIVPNTPRMIQYVQAHVLPETYRDGDPVFDGVAELWWRSLGDLEEALASPAFQEEQPEDSSRFVDQETLVGFVATERRIVWD